MVDRRKRLEVLVMLAFGVGLIGYGALELRTSRRLASEGRLATAQVVNKNIEHRAKQRKAYYLEVTFRAEQGQAFTQRSRVGAESFTGLNRGDTIPVIYLPTDPEVFALGATVKPNYFHMTMGLLTLAITGIYQLFGNSSRKRIASASSEV